MTFWWLPYDFLVTVSRLSFCIMTVLRLSSCLMTLFWISCEFVMKNDETDDNQENVRKHGMNCQTINRVP